MTANFERSKDKFLSGTNMWYVMRKSMNFRKAARITHQFTVHNILNYTAFEKEFIGYYMRENSLVA